MRCRLFKDTLERTYVDKAVQVNPVELQCMQPFSRTLSADDGSDVAYLNDSSPKSHFDHIKQENSPVCLSPILPQDLLIGDPLVG